MLRLIFENLLCFAAMVVPKSQRLWVFGSWFGQLYADNPRSVYEYVLLKHQKTVNPIWITFNKDVYVQLKRQHLPVALAQSWLGKWYMFRAGVAVFSTGYTTDFKSSCIGTKTKKVQLWHGAGLKKIGSIPRSSKEKPSHYDLMLVSSPAMKKRAIAEFGLSANKVQITGMPRLDVLANNNQIAKDYLSTNTIITQMRADRLAGNTIVLCAFTHRFDSKSSVLHDLFKESEVLDKKLKKARVVLFIKPHFYDHYLYGKNILSQLTSLSTIKIIDNESIDHTILNLFADSDLLLTDYSSTFSDFLLTKKPIIFFDPEKTVKKQNFYFDYATHTPGPKVTDWTECITIIKQLKRQPDSFLSARNKLRKVFHSYADGKNTRRAFERIKSLVT